MGEFRHGPLAADFRGKTTLGVAVIAVVLLTPFAMNNFVQGRTLLGVGSVGIIAILAANAWSISRGRYYPSLTLFGLVPAVIFFLVFALRKQGMVGALWCYPAVISFYFMLPERRAWLANGVLLGIALPEVWAVIDHPLATRVAATLLAVSAFSAIFIRVIDVQQRRLEAQAVTDPLTGLLNRMLLHDTLEQAIQQNARTGAAMTLVTLDLDHFKQVNDRFGHDAGDAVLQGVGGLLRKRLRRVDRLFRIGGEEFLVLLFATDADNARRVAESLRAAIAAHPFVPDHPVTASIGLAALRPGDDWKAWMKRSDDNLYAAKSAGRDRVVV
jgi:diguanylate cyclase (GGDEF)-like protein